MRNYIPVLLLLNTTWCVLVLYTKSVVDRARLSNTFRIDSVCAVLPDVVCRPRFVWRSVRFFCQSRNCRCFPVACWIPQLIYINISIHYAIMDIYIHTYKYQYYCCSFSITAINDIIHLVHPLVSCRARQSVRRARGCRTYSRRRTTTFYPHDFCLR